jgi:hypothetical protein
MLRVAAELAPFDAAVVRAAEVKGPDLVLPAFEARPAGPHDEELVSAVTVDVGYGSGDAPSIAYR